MYGDYSFSRKASVVLMGVGYLLLVISVPALFAAGLIFFASFLAGAPGGVLFGSVPFFFTGIGVALLIGYKRHSEGRLAVEYRVPLWLGSIVFNVCPLAAAFLYAARTPFSKLVADGTVALAPFAIWWAAVVIVSIVALFEHREDQKTR